MAAEATIQSASSPTVAQRPHFLQADALRREDWQQPIARHHYSLGQTTACLDLLLRCRGSLRGAALSMGLMSRLVSGRAEVPSLTTVRNWLLRLGLYQLRKPLQQADDWVWIVDHSLQIGQLKGLLIVGLRLSDWHTQEQRVLSHQDVQLISLIPVRTSNGEVVDGQLESAISRTGVPRLIVSDDGGDLHKGLSLFRQRHSTVDWIYDIKHKTASLLKRELERDPQWQPFTKAANQLKRQIHQTELAFCCPPAQRGKSRYMNVEVLVEWGLKMLRFVASARCLHSSLDLRRLDEKLGWIEEYRESLEHWSAAMKVVETVESYVRHEGYTKSSVRKLRAGLPTGNDGAQAQSLRCELLRFVKGNAALVGDARRLPGSSEVIESIFGKYKVLQGERGQFGITGMLLSIGGFIGTMRVEDIRNALETVNSQMLSQWERDYLGATIHSQRKRAFSDASSGTNGGTRKKRS